MNSVRRWTIILTGALVAGVMSGQVASATDSSAAVRWGACPAESLAGVPAAEQAKFSCAAYDVPMDYANASAGTVSLAMMRRAADDQAHRIGSLFVNPGGPGGSGFALPTEAERILTADVLRRFDIVGFDPRGIGRSTPALKCFTTNEDANAVFSRIVAVPVTPAEVSSTLAANVDYTKACAANAGRLLSHMSTLDVTRDLDRMRQGVGDRQLNYLGFSYGTLIGATYANLYPGRGRALILDGNVDPALRTRDGFEYLRERANGQEDVINAFLRLCADSGSRCAFSSGDPKAKFAEIRERLRRGPVTVPSRGTVTLSSFTGGVAGALYSSAGYPTLATQLQTLYEALQPSAVVAPETLSQLAAFTSASTANLADTPYSGNDSSLAVNCSDEPFPRTPALYAAAANWWERDAPTVGRQHALSQVACATWPVRDHERYSGPWHRRTANTVLLFGNYHDPATNYEFDKRMAAELGNARMVSVNGFGHTILAQANKSTCALNIATRYLIDLTVPAAGTVCTPDVGPFG